MNSSKLEVATLAAGCFWCTEAIFKHLKGVDLVTSGYAGGNVNNPSYEAVSSGTTGHAEAIQITFDPKIISFEKLLEVFFKLHDPTTLNRQGGDVGEQYRSAIFYHDETQKNIAQEVKNQMERSRIYKNPFVTKIIPFKNFYKAEDYHQNFYDNNRSYGLGPHPAFREGRERTASSAYCQLTIDPKIKKLMEEFKEEVKTTA